MTEIWFIADTHFGHENIIEYEKRPFPDVETMDQHIIKKWNDKVAPNDLVYHLGDVSLHKKARTKEILSELNGTKVLIRGNHDDNPTAMRTIGFDAVLESAWLRVGSHDCVLLHDPGNMRHGTIWHFHGHVHSRWKYKPEERSICLSVENWDYTPVNQTELSKYMDRQQWSVDRVSVYLPYEPKQSSEWIAPITLQVDA